MDLIPILTAISLFCGAPGIVPSADLKTNMSLYPDYCTKRVWKCIDDVRAKHNATPPKKECSSYESGGGWSGDVIATTGTGHFNLGNAGGGSGKITETCVVTKVEKWKGDTFEECFR